ncbi:hypothetical protein KU392_13515 [Advenella alkanexedens]|uniref:Uncharacterized protein n=1 Tax=Advenella alkanexedens TaxID=1481665 RepID=A0ABS6NRJ5_9BURK|nr:hypothetical protein [Advenella alkanexedens]MBV4398262.1 hypothetical protein [Advenella alkanexedens]
MPVKNDKISCICYFSFIIIASKQQTANSKQQTANSKQQTANSKQQTANSSYAYQADLT